MTIMRRSLTFTSLLALTVLLLGFTLRYIYNTEQYLSALSRDRRTRIGNDRSEQVQATRTETDSLARTANPPDPRMKSHAENEPILSFFVESESEKKETLPRDQNTYLSSKIEQYSLDHADELGYNEIFTTTGCNLFNQSYPLPADLRMDIDAYVRQLDTYEQLVQNFHRTTASNSVSLVQEMIELYKEQGGNMSWNDVSIQVCNTLRLHPDGITGIFPPPSSFNESSGNGSINSGSEIFSLLSRTRHSGYLEPLLPPMRHPNFCHAPWVNLVNLQYLVHDFERTCLNLKPHSKIILFDIGASLDFHEGETSPALYLLSTYHKFGFHFDHIYAYEAVVKDPNEVYKAIPTHLIPKYHWINVPVNSNKTSSTVGNEDEAQVTYLNPFQMIQREFHKDDIIIVKLDIDTPELEMQFVEQLLEEVDTNGESIYAQWIDHFYFEHHICFEELSFAWVPCNGTIQDTLQLFQTLRRKGIASHFWV